MAQKATHANEYYFADDSPSHSNEYLLPEILKTLVDLPWPQGEKKVFDLGCGNGAIAAELSKSGFSVQGVDPSISAVNIANAAHPTLAIRKGSVYDDLATTYGQFFAVISLEVVEHVFDPRQFAACIYSLLKPGGIAAVSTPYHGYWKNLALALTGQMDLHFTALWNHGHIKFFSVRTLTRLLEDAGLQVTRVQRVGRVPILAKSMIAIARRPT